MFLKSWLQGFDQRNPKMDRKNPTSRCNEIDVNIAIRVGGTDIDEFVLTTMEKILINIVLL